MAPRAGGTVGHLSRLRLSAVRAALRAGGLIVYPTEGVYGIGCDPRDHDALIRLLAMKNRPADKGLILIGCDEEQVMRYAQPLAAEQMARIRRTWPGPVTWVLPARRDVDRLVTGGRGTVAVRVTAHPVAAALCAAFGGALVSSSANPSGRPPARNALAARRMAGGALIVPGRVGAAGGPSIIRDGRSGRVLRGTGA
jgi:L-threonylcarbamoyladenylate synthase